MIEVCKALSGGAAAVFGPMSPTSREHTRSLCATVQLPHIEASSNSEPDAVPTGHNYTVNVFPHVTGLNRALVDLVRHLHWTSVTLLYINDDGTSTANKPFSFVVNINQSINQSNRSSRVFKGARVFLETFLVHQCCALALSLFVNPLTPTVAIWVQLCILYVPDRVKPSFNWLQGSMIT